MAADVASVQFSRTVKRRYARRPRLLVATSYDTRTIAGTGERRSLKTQQHAGVVAACKPVFPK